MSNRLRSRCGPSWTVFGVLVLMAASLPVTAGAETMSASGRLFLGEPKSCDSPIGNCSRSRLTGGEVKRYKFTAQEAIPNADDPNLLLLRGTSVLVMKDGGRLFSNDMVHIDLATGDVVHMWTIDGGTKRYKGATGTMAAGGSLGNLAAGGPYAYRIVVPDD